MKKGRDDFLQLLSFHWKSQGEPEDEFDISQILQKLPEADKWAFVTLQQEKIREGNNLYVILRELPEAKRLEFATLYEEIIASSDVLADVLQYLPENDRLDFALRYLDKIIEGDWYLDVLNALPGVVGDEFEAKFESAIKSRMNRKF